MSRLACSTAPFPADTLSAALARVGWAGFHGVEVWAPGDLPPESELRSRLRAEGLLLAALHAGPLPPTPDVEALARIGRAAALARALDGNLLVVTAPAAGDLAAVAAGLALLDRALGATLVDVALANAPDSLLAAPADFHALWEFGLPARVHPALDPAAAVAAGWLPTLDGLPRPPRHVYLTDWDGAAPALPGAGGVDFGALAAELARLPYDGWLTATLAGADPWAVEPAAREVREAAEAWFGPAG
jgi:sugar phosphate isomerase/epimerase